MIAQGADIEDRPTLMPGLDLYFNAFQDLQSERPVGMALGQIPWSSIIRWAEHYSLSDKDFIEKLIRFMRAMERTLNEHQEKQEGRDNGK